MCRDLVRGHAKLKVKAFQYSIPSVGPGADPGVQAVSRQVTVSHPPGGRLPLLSARLVSDIAVFVLKRDVKLQLTN